MPKKSDYSFLLYSIVTFVVACFTYVILSFVTPASPHHHDFDSVMIDRERLQGDIIIDNQLQSLLDQALSETHQSAPTNDEVLFQTLCKEYQIICNKTTFAASSLTTRQQIYYQVIVIYILQKLSSFGIFSDYLSDITIKSKSVALRGFTSDATITLDIKAMRTYNEFLQVLVHEFGHIVDLQQIVGTKGMVKDKLFTEFGQAMFSLDDPSLAFYKLSRSNENTRLSTARYEDFVSGYGMSDIFEDFAESFNFYINYNQIFQKLTLQSPILKQKYDYLNQLLGGKFINNGQTKQASFEQYDWDFRPYDTTRF